MDPIRAHLETGWLPMDITEARKMTIKASRYVLIDGVLYKKSFSNPLLKVLEANRGRDGVKGST